MRRTSVTKVSGNRVFQQAAKGLREALCSRCRPQVPFPNRAPRLRCCGGKISKTSGCRDRRLRLRR